VTVQDASEANSLAWAAAAQRLALILEPGRAVNHHARRIHLGGHIGDHHLDGLMARQRHAELLPLIGVAHPFIETGLGDAQRLGGDPDAPGVQGRQADGQALPGLAEQMVPGDPAVIQADRGDRIGAHAAQILQVAHHESLGRLFRPRRR
jgi:hypothetical protein